jgi:uncharacterized protein
MLLNSILFALAGGVLIGLAAAILLIINGRILGVSGIVHGILWPQPHELGWRLAFIAGLVLAGFVFFNWGSEFFLDTTSDSLIIKGLAGLLVGFGTRMGSGCTSGHGVCGISRFSKRSIVATLVFMAAGAATIIVVRLLGVNLL